MEPQQKPEGQPLFQQLVTLEAHSSSVSTIAFSPDCQYLASGSSDKTVRLWEVESGALVHTLIGHLGDVLSIAFSSNAHRIASASADKTIRLWDPSSGDHLSTLEGHEEWVRATAFSPDGTLLASASLDGTVRLWNIITKTQVTTLHHNAYCIAFSLDGAHLVSGSYGSIHFWEVASGVEVIAKHGHTAAVISVAFSQGGTLLASGSTDHTIRLWNAVSGDHVVTLHGHSGWVWSVSFSSHDGLLVSGSDDKTVRPWDVTSKSLVAILANGLETVYSVAFSPSGSHIASGIGDGTILLWQRAKEIALDPTATNYRFEEAESSQDITNTNSPSAAYLPTTSFGNDISNSVTLVDSNRISSGGFGDIFVGAHKDLGKVAMKRPHVLLSETSLRRLLREVSLWCNMSHRYILPCLGTCKIGQEVYMVSPFIENGDLMTCIQRGMKLDRCKLLCETAEAITHLHHKGIIHGDIKAQNILISDDGSALLCDFGLAKALDTMVTSTEVKGGGSLRWMPPEVFHGESRSMASDVYSFGITIAEVLSGRLPFDHLTENVAVMLYIILSNGRPTKKESDNLEDPLYSVLWEMAEKCWVTTPKDRPSMAQVLGRLFPLTLKELDGADLSARSQTKT